MSFAMTLRVDATSARRIARLWVALDAAGIDSSRNALGYPAHVTLAVFRDEAPREALCAALTALAAEWPVLPLTLAGFGVFPAPSYILWLAPVPTAALLARHAALLAALPELSPHPHYVTDAWVPHVTLSGALRDPSEALQAILPLWQPMHCWLDCAELVRFPPVDILCSRQLPV